MLKPALYPLTFTPILKEKIWGGAKLKTVFGKMGEGKLGESWELSNVPGDISKVSNGSLTGKSLTDLIKVYGSELLGKRIKRHYGTKFPLLFKFIDAAEDLSVQLHPDDVIAKEKHNSFGKTEMWYIMQAEKDARLLIGLKDGVDKDAFVQHISENKILDVIETETIKKGDAFYIAPGIVHAIGAGTVLAEIQQTSDVTYRIYDWDRPGLDGKMRKLHTEDAVAAIKFDTAKPRLEYELNAEGVTLVCESPYFKTSKINCTDKLDLDYTDLDCFKVYMCVAGNAVIKTEVSVNEMKKGETLLIPACIERVTITSENAEILEVYIP